jgi:hypothetical protein
MVEEDILRLEVAVYNVQGMKVFQSEEDFGPIEAHPGLIEAAGLSEMKEQFPSRTIVQLVREPRSVGDTRSVGNTRSGQHAEWATRRVYGSHGLYSITGCRVTHGAATPGKKENDTAVGVQRRISGNAVSWEQCRQQVAANTTLEANVLALCLQGYDVCTSHTKQPFEYT